MTLLYEKKFKKALAELNPQQLKAVNQLEGPVLVFAGPGTGKTQVLTLRIANLIYQGAATPNEILALTFTRAAAQNMQARLASFIGPDAFKVNFNTFHGFCQEIIADQPENFLFPLDSQPVDDLTKIQIIERLIKTLPLESLRPAGKIFYYLKKIITQIDTLKRENITPDSYQELLHASRQDLEAQLALEQQKKRPSKSKINHWQKSLSQQTELGLIYQAYQQELSQKKLYDFADMILQTVTAFQNNSDLLADYQEKYQYFLIDEYQDTNNAQDEIINLLASHWQDSPNVFVVGDPQQSIYRFQGANLENFLSFTKRYPSSQLITLDTGYRCSNKIYNLAQALIDSTNNRDNRLGEFKALTNHQNRAGLPVLLTECASQDSEIIHLLQSLQKLHQQGTPYDRMAIIYRNNSDSARLLELCSYYQIPVEIEGGDDILKQDFIQKLILLFRLLIVLDQPRLADEYLYQLFYQPWLNFNQLDILHLHQLAKKNHYSLLQIITNQQHPFWSLATSEEYQLSQPQALLAFGQLLLDWQTLSRQKNLIYLYHQLISQSNLISWIESKPEKYFLLTYLYSLERQISLWTQEDPQFNLNQFLQRLDAMMTHKLKIAAEDLNLRQEALSLTTVHKAKGREWDHVFIYGVNEKTWSNIREPASISLPAGIIKEQSNYEKKDEELRLLFVALTRAKIQAHLSWHLSVANSSSSKAPSQFIFILQEHQADGWCQMQEPLLDAQTTPEQLITLLSPPPSINLHASTRDFFAQKVKSLIMSASLLNDYLADTHLFITRHLLSAPEGQTSAALELGNSLHQVLEKTVKQKISQGSFLPLSSALELFTQDFLTKNLEEPEKSLFHQRGLDSLTAYYQAHFLPQADFIPLFAEQKFGYGRPLSYLHVPLRGKIDRIDLLDESSKLAQVTDYKTGRSATINEILGKTNGIKLSDREKILPPAIQTALKRQLLFYKLLAHLDSKFPYQVESGVLDFVHVGTDKKPVRRVIPLLDEDLQLLQDLIVTVWTEIQDLAFLDFDQIEKT